MIEAELLRFLWSIVSRIILSGYLLGFLLQEAVISMIYFANDPFLRIRISRIFFCQMFSLQSENKHFFYNEKIILLSSSLTHYYPIHPFITPWKHQKTVFKKTFSAVIRGFLFHHKRNAYSRLWRNLHRNLN